MDVDGEQPTESTALINGHAKPALTGRLTFQLAWATGTTPKCLTLL